jgi:serine phosphatase RsbU (regulator of sigma subunit)
VYLFTDGVTEANNAAGDLFSEERLETVLREAGGRPSADLVRSVTEAVRDFVGNALPSDDITMLAVRRLDPAKM